MSQKLEVLYNRKPSYNIVIEGDFNQLSEETKDLDCSNKKICIITDSIVGAIYLEELTKVLEPICKKVVSYSFQAGEERKNLSTINEIYRFLIDIHKHSP